MYRLLCYDCPECAGLLAEFAWNVPASLLCFPGMCRLISWVCLECAGLSPEFAWNVPVHVSGKLYCPLPCLDQVWRSRRVWCDVILMFSRNLKTLQCSWNINLYNKTSHSIRIYVPYSRLNGWTDWAEIFCGHSWVAGGCYRLKNNSKFFFQIIFLFSKKKIFKTFKKKNFSTGKAGPFS